MNRPYLIHISSLVLTKTADGLIDPKLVLAWLLNAIGAPGYIIGILVPVRESGSLLPQLFLAQKIEARRQRKWFWVTGSAVQGAAAAGIAAAAYFLSGPVAGWVILLCLAVLAVARAACSASFKDILARTVEKGNRGKVSGTASTIAATVVFIFAILLSFGIWPREPAAVAFAVFLAGLLWLAAAALFARLSEPDADARDDNDTTLPELVQPLWDDKELQTYIATRGLLISTALAPPFLVMLGNLSSGALGNLGVLIIASALASIISSYVWGALSDRSSRKTLIVASGAAAVTYVMAALSGFAGVGVGSDYLIPILIFMAQIAYEGARAGRKTHLTDMDAEGRTAVYTALSNTVIGVMLVFGGLLGFVADAFGPGLVLLILAVLSGFAMVTAWQLSEVQAE
ncbi:MFS transporter [Roseobacter sp. CCS2]|uniref:MFS transporter n=1 Tax=Roseobacter sp. CCS2 TaxID=391593 RepID=UPI0000F3F79A|nr:MFS transporter [Roseobacter sp. CCS2]EBA10592.1 permease of the major facilitator superfamily protein [Roseobacter sp. CCS2]